MKTRRKEMMKSGLVISLSLLDMDDRVMSSRGKAIDEVSPTAFQVEDSNLYAGSIQHEEREETEIMDAASYWTLIALMLGMMIYFN